MKTGPIEVTLHGDESSEASAFESIFFAFGEYNRTFSKIYHEYYRQDCNWSSKDLSKFNSAALLYHNKIQLTFPDGSYIVIEAWQKE